MRHDWLGSLRVTKKIDVTPEAGVDLGGRLGEHRRHEVERVASLCRQIEAEAPNRSRPFGPVELAAPAAQVVDGIELAEQGGPRVDCAVQARVLGGVRPFLRVPELPRDPVRIGGSDERRRAFAEADGPAERARAGGCRRSPARQASEREQARPAHENQQVSRRPSVSFAHVRRLTVKPASPGGRSPGPGRRKG